MTPRANQARIEKALDRLREAEVARAEAVQELMSLKVMREEAIEILEEIARDPDCYPTSRVTAIRTLLELDKEREPEPSDFADLDALPLVRRRARHRPA